MAELATTGRTGPTYECTDSPMRGLMDLRICRLTDLRGYRCRCRSLLRARACYVLVAGIQRMAHAAVQIGGDIRKNILE
jgi:hypothetical protein